MPNSSPIVYLTGKTVKLQLQNIEDEKWLLATGINAGQQEAYNASNEALYNISMTEIGAKGIYIAVIPTIIVLPGRFRGYAIDSNIVIGMIFITLDENGNIIDEEDEIFAGIVGENSGVGSNTETYKGAAGKPRFKTTFVGGNRDTVEHGDSI